MPVGGGCRKTKRSSKPKPNSESSAQTQTQTPTEAPAAAQRERKTNSHSSSESSSTLTVTNNNNNNNTTSVEAVSVHSSSSGSNVLSAMNNNNNDPGFEPATTTALLDQGSSDCGIFSEIGSFTSLITSSNEALPFGFSNLLNNAQQNLEHVQDEQQQQWQQEQQKMASASSMGGHQELKLHEMASGLLDQTVRDELSALQDRSGNNGGFGSLDWHGSGDHQGLFDLPNVVDHASYWSQSTQWTDQDHPSLYLP